ncbi:MAG: hypothetical protein ACK4ZN_06450 [Oceanibaculum sp.]
MSRPQRRNPLAAATGLAFLCLAVAGPVAPASAQISAEEAGKRLAEAYSVRVLDIRPVQHDGREAYAARVMRTGPDAGSAAFQVVTLLVDPATGDLIPAFGHGAAGYSTSATDSHVPRLDSSGSQMRRMSTRPSPRN